MGTIDNIYSTLKRAKKISDSIKNVELLDVLATLKYEASCLKDELAALREENTNLQHQADLRSKLVCREGLYHLTEPVSGLSQGPFCPTCWENRSTPITLQGSECWCNVCGICFRPTSE